VLATACAELSRVDGCGVSVSDSGGTSVFLHATDTVAAAIEDLQLTLGEGPCVDVAESRAPVLVADLRDRSGGLGGRWPMFLTEVDALGVRALFAFPVSVGAIVLGVVDLYRSTPGPLPGAELSAALTTVDAIGHQLLGNERGDPDDGDPTNGLGGAEIAGETFSFSMSVHQAAGMVMVQLSSSIEEALLRLRAVAFADSRPLNEVAADVVAGRLRLDREKS
jgi:hypothetical protein